jgi:hypothetical protein
MRAPTTVLSLLIFAGCSHAQPPPPPVLPLSSQACARLEAPPALAADVAFLADGEGMCPAGLICFDRDGFLALRDRLAALQGWNEKAWRLCGRR